LILNSIELASTLYTAISYRHMQQNNMGNSYKQIWLII
jgi:hypothetical protein